MNKLEHSHLILNEETENICRQAIARCQIPFRISYIFALQVLDFTFTFLHLYKILENKKKNKKGCSAAVAIRSTAAVMAPSRLFTYNNIHNVYI